MRVGGVGEEVVRLGRPSSVGPVQRFEVARGRRVEGVDGSLVGMVRIVTTRVDVLDELVEVLVPRVRVLVGYSFIGPLTSANLFTVVKWNSI